MDFNLQKKLADEHLKYLQSPGWELLKNQFRGFQANLRESISSNVRSGNFYAASLIQGKVDAVDELIRITERLGKDIVNDSLVADDTLASLKIMRDGGY